MIPKLTAKEIQELKENREPLRMDEEETPSLSAADWDKLVVMTDADFDALLDTPFTHRPTWVQKL